MKEKDIKLDPQSILILFFFYLVYVTVAPTDTLQHFKTFATT